MAKIIGKIKEEKIPPYNKLREEYLNFYKNYKGPKEDFFDAFYEYKTKDLPPIEVSRGSGWVVDDGGYKTFYSADSGYNPNKPPTQFGKPVKGEKAWVSDYREPESNPLKREYGLIIKDLQNEYISDKLRREKMQKMSEEIKKPSSIILQSLLSERNKI